MSFKSITGNIAPARLPALSEEDYDSHSPEVLIPHWSLSFHFTTDHPLDLAGYKGSPFRGLFGYTLKKLACPLPRNDCAGCLLRATCVYLTLFETPADLAALSPYQAGPNRLPHPFILTPPLERGPFIPGGSPFVMEMTLLRPSLAALPHVLLACQEMGRLGVGHPRVPFRLEEARIREADGWRAIYQPREGLAGLPDAADAPLAPLRTPPWPAPRAVRLESVTPLRIKSGGRIIQALDFAALMRALLRRLDLLARLYGTGPLPVDFVDVIARAGSVRTNGGRMVRSPLRRYSKRQKRWVRLDGLEGWIAFKGDLAPFVPWLLLGERLHVGKGTAFGLGRYRLEWSHE